MGSSKKWKRADGSVQVADWKFTYQDRISEFRGVALDAGNTALSAYAELHGRIERTLFAQFCAGVPLVSLKSSYLIKYKISARMFNSLRVALEGKISAVRESMELRVESLKRRIARAEGQVAEALKQGRLNAAHQKKRRLSNLVHRLDSLRSDISDGLVRLCFGSKKLWHKQYWLGATAILTMMDGRGSGVLPGQTSSSSWGARMRVRVASCVWPRCGMMV